ncbi:MAG: hypothetical protein ACRD3O_12040 [Terriglobia bacterium]
MAAVESPHFFCWRLYLLNASLAQPSATHEDGIIERVILCQKTGPVSIEENTSARPNIAVLNSAAADHTVM